MDQIATCAHCKKGFFSWENPLREPSLAFHPTCFLAMASKPLDQATRDASKEIAASLQEDLEAAHIPGNRPDADTHEDRLRAIEAALSVLLHTLSEEPKP